MRTTTLLFVIFLLLLKGTSFCQSSYPTNYFSSPLDIPLSVIGTFGEIRADHFHSGIDLSTNEEEGKKVYAAASGYVSRIKIAPDGFGKAIYITHPNGYVTVYAHLKRFNAVIEKYIRKIQYANESFAVDQFPKPIELPVKKGEVIAFSGSTGGAEGPHLHFEIRDAKTEWPINPLLFGFKIPDVVSPKISQVKIYSLHHQGAVINSIESASYKVSNVVGGNLLLGPEVINVFGSIGLGIETEDKMQINDKKYGLGVYSVEMKVDDVRKYYFRFDKFSFDETRYANAHIDYEEEVLHDAAIQRCYRLPGNKVSIDANPNLSGELTMDDGLAHQVEFIVTDYAGNISTLFLSLQSEFKLSELSFPSPPEEAIVISESKGININTNDINIKIPAGAVYDETWFTFSKTTGHDKAFSAVHHVGNKTDAVQNPITLEIKPDVSLSVALQSKAAIVSFKKDGSVKYEGGEWKSGFVTTSVRHFGDFEVMIDTTPPVIKIIEELAALQHQKILKISFKLSDNLSGIESYRATIDGKFFLLEFDAKTGILSGEIERSKSYVRHAFELIVSDKRANKAFYTTQIAY